MSVGLEKGWTARVEGARGGDDLVARGEEGARHLQGGTNQPCEERDAVSKSRCSQRQRAPAVMAFDNFGRISHPLGCPAGPG